jgi:C_GCAxxG_C_C family probable redox protein
MILDDQTSWPRIGKGLEKLPGKEEMNPKKERGEILKKSKASEAAEKAYQLGKEYERTYRGCSQCAIAALQDVLEVGSDEVFKAATGLAGGTGLACDSGCGAYMGAVLFLGSILGRERKNFSDAEGVRFKTHQLVRKYRDRFIKEYGSVVCRDIQNKMLGRYYYLPDPQEFEKFHNAGAHDVHCPEVVGKAAQWMTEIILEEGLVNQ